MKERRGRTPAKLRGWIGSSAHREQARALCIAWNEAHAAKPRCGAHARTTGEPCQQHAMSNGRCRLHGGRTPKGDGAWHRIRVPGPNAANAMDKLERKLRDHDRKAKAREKRIAAMTDEERAKYDKWKREHKPGNAADRKAAKDRRKQAADARELLDRPEPSNEPLDALQRQIRELEEHAERLARQHNDEHDVFS